MGEIMLFQTAIDSYRERLLSELKSRSVKLLVSCGDEYFTKSVRTRIKYPHKKLINKYFMRRKLLYQIGAISAAREHKIIVVEMNPRIITTWILIVMARFKKQKIFVWGHFFGRSNDAKTISIWRKFMCAAASGGILAYTELEKKLFLEIFPKKRVYSVTNSLYFKREILPIEFEEDPKDFAYCGRLDSDKQVEDIIWAFESALLSGVSDSKLHLIGDGPELLYLKQIVKEKNTQSKIIFHGHISDVEKLRTVFSQCCAQITNGFVGLNVIQSLGFGLPLIYPVKAKLRHAPESYLLNEKNSVTTEGSIESLAKAICNVYVNRRFWHIARGDISQPILKNHTIESMADGFVGVLEDE